MLEKLGAGHAVLTRLQDYQPTPYTIPEVRLSFRLGLSATCVTAELSLVPRGDESAGKPLVLSGRAELEAVMINHVPLPPEAYKLEAGQLEIINPPSTSFLLTLKTRLNPGENKSCMGLYHAGGVFCTQCEPEGFRHITYFYDRPDIMSIYRVRIEGEKSSLPQLLSNGNLIDAGDLPDGYHFAEWHDPHPKPCYLFALVAADLGMIENHFVTSENRNVVLRIFVARGDEDKAWWAMESLKKAMKWDEERFGRAYDLDLFMLVAVSAFNFGAMENKGLNIFNDRYVLADPETATDHIYETIEAIVAHEYFHNWTGDRITCRDWFQLCVKEGLTVYRDQEFTSDLRSRSVKRIEDVNLLVSRQWTEDSGPLAHPPRPDQYQQIDNFYTVTVYEKGAEIVRMLATRLGDAGFRKGMDLYFSRHDNQAVTVEDFLKALGDANDCDLSSFMAWYREAGTPIVEVDYTYNAASETSRLVLTPKSPEGPAVTESVGKPIPVRLGFIDATGGVVGLPPETPNLIGPDMVELKGEPLTIELTHQHSPLVPSVLRGFSAPVKTRQNLDLNQRIHLVRHDSDPYVRYESMRQVVISVNMKALNDFSSSIDELYQLQDLRAELLEDDGLDDRFKAMISGYGFSFYDFRAQFDHDLPLDAYHDLREKCADLSPSDRLRRVVEGYFERLPAIPEPYSPDGIQVRLRAIKARLLGFLASFRSEEALSLVRSAYQTAPNLTEQLGALTPLCLHDQAKADDCLADFRALVGDNVLKFDYYLGLKVNRCKDQPLDCMKQVMADPLYERDNPNRVRALLGAFINTHGRTFHARDGSGYAFILSEIERLDGVNPSLAAGLAKGFDLLPKLELERRNFITDGLKHLGARADCSSHLSDFINRML